MKKSTAGARQAGGVDNADVGVAEAANLNALGDYSLCYGSLLMLALLGVLALMIALGVPVYGHAGHVGAVDVFSMLSRLSACLLLLAAVYAGYCRVHSSGKVRVSAELQLFVLAAMFWCAGLGNMEGGKLVARLLRWLGDGCSAACGVSIF
ncbi:hypothetical protein [Undibacterium sp.]|uniref:hypothetical protein n=1 Tax=Undibacterium sp. TaxID=1914977 RepID=UPI00374DE8EA